MIMYKTDFYASQISTIRLGEKIDLVIFPQNLCKLKKILKFLYEKKYYFRVFGNLSNVLFTEPITFPVIVTGRMETEISGENNIISVSAGTTINKLCEYLRKNELSGFETLSGIPATIGGAVFSNAGAFGSSISDRLISVQVFFNGKILTLTKNQIKFAYHFSNLLGFVVLQATFLFENRKEYDIMNLFNEYTYRRNKSQPGGFSLGSVFKKCGDKSAGFYIERCGLKGQKVGGLFVSNKHANFFINDGTGSVSDFLCLESRVSSGVLDQFGISLYTEIEKVGNKDETHSGFTHSLKI